MKLKVKIAIVMNGEEAQILNRAAGEGLRHMVDKGSRTEDIRRVESVLAQIEETSRSAGHIAEMVNEANGKSNINS